MAFKPTASKRHKNNSDGELNMNSMMDMVTIILLFLLKTYSTEGSLKTAAGDLKLPESYRTAKPFKRTIVAVSKTVILLNDVHVMTREEVPSEENLINQLKTPLEKVANQIREIENYGGEFNHEILLMIDKETPFEVVAKIIYTCSKADFYNVKLFVQGFGLDIS
jgi:biopolymer transport protein ExbD